MRTSIVVTVLLLVTGLLLGTALYAEQAAQGSGQSAVSAPQSQPAGVASKGKTALEVPDFTLQDQDGKAVALADYAGKVIVLEWLNPDCPYVQRHYNNKTMQTLAGKYADKGVVWLAINSTATSDQKVDKAWAAKHKLDYPILDDHGGKVARLYGAKTTPHMFVIDRRGKLVYKGAIDDDPQGSKEPPVNYVDTVLQKLTSGQAVSLQETKSYGCSVKYSRS